MRLHTYASRHLRIYENFVNQRKNYFPTNLQGKTNFNKSSRTSSEYLANYDVKKERTKQPNGIGKDKTINVSISCSINLGHGINVKCHEQCLLYQPG